MDYWTARYHEEEGLEHERKKANKGKQEEPSNVVYFDTLSDVNTLLTWILNSCSGKPAPDHSAGARVVLAAYFSGP